ncbi:FecR domain-containing protein [Brucepastera parasyntrophica]|uniref:FecR domain-containing protein n=1 Tax=Brucepastera parasyntrophica TaxID=2880008 RepID=UPI00210D90FB|nr:FecR domain-containing protein [Brucepastera parasyntrophica]ULQ60649.1 FecR domain-containing protein [Brucepastera parasyntrophica]
MKKQVFTGILLIFGCIAVLSAQVVGQIDYMEGRASLIRNGEEVKNIGIGTSIENLDQITTQSDGLISIAFNRDSGLTGNIQIVPKTTAIIRQDNLSGGASNEVQLMTGAVNLKVKRLAGVNSGAQVRTSSSVLGVRGTEFSAASFNGASIVACKEGEVFCTTTDSKANGLSSVPGVMVEISNSGTLRAVDFPEGDFDTNWGEVYGKWQEFNIELFVSDSVGFINQLMPSWKRYSSEFTKDVAKLRSNSTMKKWITAAKTGASIGTRADWAREKPSVTRELVSIRPNAVLTMIHFYRLQEVIPLIPKSEMNRKLSDGQTVQAFVTQFNKDLKKMAEDMAFYNAAEKQYMLRNDGISPFADF